MLARWLLTAAGAEEIRRRQMAISELRDNLTLREEWAALGDDYVGDLESTVLEEWAKTPTVVLPRSVQVAGIALPVALFITVCLGLLGTFGSLPWFAAALVIGAEAVTGLVLLKRTRLVMADVDLPAFEVTRIAPLLERFCKERFRSAMLATLQSHVVAQGCRPTKVIKKLAILTWLMKLRQSEYLAALLSLLLWGTNLALIIERWRQRYGTRVCEWMDSLAEFEALLCISRYYYENPDYIFPSIRAETSAYFCAKSLGHPLLNKESCVRSDIELDATMRPLMMVTGSNMSGKSTLLRSVGINAVLAFAGAPVEATRLDISPMQIACSISVHDSLLEGKSRFQAEAERVRWITSAAQSTYVLFLLDELLGGTNSADRLLGTEAIIEHLINDGAVGLITTHDLAVATLADNLGDRAVNIYFEEHYERGQNRFDYKPRLGKFRRPEARTILAALGMLPR